LNDRAPEMPASRYHFGSCARRRGLSGAAVKRFRCPLARYPELAKGDRIARRREELANGFRYVNNRQSMSCEMTLRVARFLRIARTLSSEVFTR
jgi:hypothetical protein